VAGLVAAIVALRVISYIYLGFKEKRYKLSQEKYYKEEFKEDMAKSLFYFFLDLKDLFNRHYENNYDGVSSLFNTIEYCPLIDVNPSFAL
jgi:hypothetical protein